jgi:hypothetical protein
VSSRTAAEDFSDYTHRGLLASGMPWSKQQTP